MTGYPLVSRDASATAVTPYVPLHFVHPGLSFAQIFSIVRAYLKISLLMLLVGLALTAAVMSWWPRTYTAQASLMVSYEVNDPSAGKDLPTGQVGSYIATQVELMQTPEVLLAVVDRLGLTGDADYASGWRDGRGTLREWVAAKIAKSLSVFQSERGSQLIYVTYAADEPNHAAKVANAVVAVYKEQDQMRSAGPPGERATRYAQQLDGLKAKVDQAQGALTSFQQRYGLIDAPGRANVDVMLLGTLEERLLAAQNARRVAEANASQDQTASDEVLASTQAQALRLDLTAQEMRLEQANRVFMPQHPDVIEAKMRVDGARRALAATVRSYASNSSAGLNAALRLERGLEKAVDAQRAKILTRGGQQDEAAKFQLGLDSAQAVYKRALDGYDQIAFASTARSSNVSVVSNATAPVRASKPRVLVGLLLGTLASGLLAFGIPLGYELIHRRVRCRDDLERHHGIPVLAEFGRLPMRATA